MANESTPKVYTFPVMRVRQPIGDFFIGAIDAEDLVSMCVMDMRRMSAGGIDGYLGIQRRLSKARVTELREYVRTSDATFPTSVILSIDDSPENEVVSLAPIKDGPTDDVGNPRLFLMTVKDEGSVQDALFPEHFGVARILDGQHRVEGLKNYDGPPFEVNVAIFVGLDIASQATVFGTVNLAQTKVNKSLVYDLLEYSRFRSPEKTCHDIAVALDEEPDSPFYQRIKRLGVATDGRFGETLSQATFVTGLLPHLSSNVIRDREVGRSAIPLPFPDPDDGRLVLRQLYKAGDKDDVIGAMIWDYFATVKERWSTAWDLRGRGYILNKSTGYLAFARFFRDAFLESRVPGEVVTKEEFARVLSRSKLTDNDFTTERYKPGSTGIASLYHDLVRDCKTTLVPD